MPINFQGQIRPANSLLPGYAEAQAIAAIATQHFGNWRSTIQPSGGGGLGVGSCCAAFAVNPTADYPAEYPNPFALVFGNSQMAAQGMVWHPGWNVGGHAERTALNIASHDGLVPWTGPAGSILYVELEPCPPCAAWLTGGGNPYSMFFVGNSLQVWWGWNYPIQVKNMTDFHKLPLGAQGAMVGGW